MFSSKKPNNIQHIHNFLFCCGKYFIYLRKRSIFKPATNLCFQMTKLKALKKKKKANNLLSPPTFLPHEFLVIEVPEMLNEVDKKSNLCNCDRFENAPSLVVSISGSCPSTKAKHLSFFLNRSSFHSLIAAPPRLLCLINICLYISLLSSQPGKDTTRILHIVVSSGPSTKSHWYSVLLMLMLIFFLLIRFTKQLFLCQAICYAQQVLLLFRFPWWEFKGLAQVL